MADVTITEYTDPGCPWAFSAEPFRLRLNWLYGDAIDWQLAMVGRSESPEEYEEKGMTPESLAAGIAKIAAEVTLTGAKKTQFFAANAQAGLVAVTRWPLRGSSTRPPSTVNGRMASVAAARRRS